MSNLLDIKAAAILALDITAYSKMMEIDEIGTHLIIRQHRQELIDNEILDHGGRIIKFTGDGMLIAFDDPSSALRAALRIQREMHERNLRADVSKRVLYRMGINAGKVIIDHGDVFGVDVIIAVRLESIAPPGGICMSKPIFDMAETALQPLFLHGGTPLLKHIEKPVEVFFLGPERVSQLPRLAPAAMRPPPVQVRGETWARLAGRCSIAVLSFDNIGLDRTQDYFSDGLVSDIADALSMFRNLFVISTRSSFTYRNPEEPLAKIADELGVRYLVTGSVRLRGDQLRVSARLTDNQDHHQIWAQHFEGQISNIFRLQDEVTRQIVMSVEPRVRAEEIKRASRKPPASLGAYDFFLQAVSQREVFTEASYQTMVDLLDSALALDGSYGAAMAHKAMCRCIQRDRGWPVPGVDTTADALRLAARAIELSPDDPAVLCLAGHATAIISRTTDAGLPLLTRALKLNPNFAEAWTRKAWIHVYRNELVTAVDHADRALDLSPVDPQISFALGAAAAANFFLTNYEHSYGYARRALGLSRIPFWIYLLAVAACDGAGRTLDARALRAEFEGKWPGFNVFKWLFDKSPYTDERQVAALRLAFDNVGFRGSTITDVE